MLARAELALDDGAAGVDEGPPVAFEALHDEALAAEQPTPIFFWNAMPIDTPLAAHRNASFWQISSPPHPEVDRDDLAGVGRGEGDLSCRTVVGEHGHEQALAGEQALARAQQRVHQAALLVRPSPKMVSMLMPSSMYIIAPASATTLSPGSSSISTNCISSPKIW